MPARRLAACLVLFLLMPALAADAAAPVGDLLRTLRIVPLATPPPRLALQRLGDGRTVTLQELRGRPVLVYFWASW